MRGVDFVQSNVLSNVRPYNRYMPPPDTRLPLLRSLMARPCLRNRVKQTRPGQARSTPNITDPDGLSGWLGQRHARQIQLALEGLLAQCAIKRFEVAEAVLVAGFQGFDFFDDGGELVLKR